MTRIRNVTRSIASNWAGLAINIAISFFLSPFVVNKLGSVYYGIWAVAMQFTGYLYLLDFGVRESVIRYTSKYTARGQQTRLSHVLTTALLTYVPITALCLVAVGVCAWAAPYAFDIERQHWAEARWAIVFVGLTIAQTFLLNVFVGILHGLNRFDVANVLNTAFAVVRAGLVVLLLSKGGGLVALAAIQFGVSLASGLISAAYALRLLRRAGMGWRFGIPDARRFRALSSRVFGYGFYVLLNNLGQKLIFTSDVIVIGLLLPIASVTPYAIATSLIEYLRSLFMATAQVFNPVASHLHATRQSADVESVLVGGAKLTVIVTLPIALTLAILGRDFVGLWMGEQYADPAGQVLLVLALLQIVSAPHYVIAFVLYGISKHRTMAFVRAAEASVNIALSIVLAKTMGIVGVAIALATAHGVSALFVIPTLARRFAGVSMSSYYLGAFGGPLMAAVPFIVATFALRAYWPAGSLWEFFGQVAALVALYAPCVYAIALNGRERAMLFTNVRRVVRLAG